MGEIFLGLFVCLFENNQRRYKEDLTDNGSSSLQAQISTWGSKDPFTGVI